MKFKVNKNKFKCHSSLSKIGYFSIWFLKKLPSQVDPSATILKLVSHEIAFSIRSLIDRYFSIDPSHKYVINNILMRICY